MKQRSLAGLKQGTIQFNVGNLTPESPCKQKHRLINQTLHIFVHICLTKEGKDHVGGLTGCITLTRSFDSLPLIFQKFQNKLPLSN